MPIDCVLIEFLLRPHNQSLGALVGGLAFMLVEPTIPEGTAESRSLTIDVRQKEKPLSGLM